MPPQPSGVTAEWVGALSTAGLGVLGIGVTAWQWRAGGFRPKLRAYVDRRGDAIQVDIVNRGRADGLIHQVAVVGPDNLLETDHAEFDGFDKGQYTPTYLPGLGAFRLIINAAEEFQFSAAHRVRMDWGDKSKLVTPQPVDVGLYGMKTLPPPPR